MSEETARGQPITFEEYESGAIKLEYTMTDAFPRSIALLRTKRSNAPGEWTRTTCASALNASARSVIRLANPPHKRPK